MKRVVVDLLREAHDDDKALHQHQTNRTFAAGVFGVMATGFSVLLGFVIFLAFTAYDSSRAGAEGVGTQAMLTGSVSVVVATLLLLLVFLDRPHGEGAGALRPTAMERSLRLVDREVPVADVDSLCDRDGTRR